MKLLSSIAIGIAAGIVTFIIGAILAGVATIAWLVELGGVFKGVSALVALAVFLWLYFGRPDRRAF